MANDRLPPLPAGFDPVDELPPLPDGYEDADKPASPSPTILRDRQTGKPLILGSTAALDERNRRFNEALATITPAPRITVGEPKRNWTQPGEATIYSSDIYRPDRGVIDLVKDTAIATRSGMRSGAVATIGLPWDVVNTINAGLNKSADALAGIFGADAGPGVPMAAKPAWLQSLDEHGRSLDADESNRAISSTAQFDTRNMPDTFGGVVRSAINTPGALIPEAGRSLGTMVSSIVPGSAGGTIALQALQQAGMTVSDVERELVAEGWSPDAARSTAIEVFAPAAGVGLVLPRALPGGAATEKLLSGTFVDDAVKSGAIAALGRVATPVAGEAITGGLEEGWIQMLSNNTAGNPLGQGVGGATGLGTILGGGIGTAPAAVQARREALRALAPKLKPRSEIVFDPSRNDVIPEEWLADLPEGEPPLPEGYEPVETALTPEVFANRAAPPMATAAIEPEVVVEPESRPAAQSVPAVPERIEVTADTGRGNFRLVDDQAAPGADVSEFGQLREVTAYDGDNVVGTLLYANDGTPPTVNVEPEYQNRGIAKAMYDLAGQQGGKLGTAQGGMSGRGPQYRTPAGERFRQGMDARPPTVFAPVASPAVESPPAPPSPASPQAVASPPVEAVVPSADTRLMSDAPPETAPVMGSLDVKPVAPQQTESSPPPTGTKNAVTDAEREAESRDPVVRDMRRTNRQTVDMAQEALRENPRMVDEIVARSHDTAISDVEEAALLVTKVQERNKREEASKTLADPNATKSQKDAARRAWDDAEAKIAEIDAANVARGRDWGRMGNFRRRLMAADFTLPALESKLRRAKGEPLTAEETASLKDLADRLQKTEGDLAAARKQIEEYEQNTIVRQTIEQAIKEALGQVRREGRAPAGKTKLEAMRERAEKARRSLAATPDVPSNRGQSGAVMSPTVFVDLYHIGAYHVANGASKFADWAKTMAADVGAKFTALEHYWPEIFAASKAESAITDRIYAGKSVRTTAEVLAGINPESLTREDVRDLVFARIKAGAKDADAIMKAVTADVQTLVPAATEADVRQLFADYGKRASPSRDADRTTLQNLRTIVRLENDIAKAEAGVLKKRGEPKRKASEEVRQLRERLSELLRIAERSDPAAIAAIRQARVDNLHRRIADLEDQIATGRRPEKRKATEKSVEEAALEARRDELLREIRSIDRPKPDPEQRYQQARATSIANEVKRLEERLKNNDYSRTPRVPKVLSEANQKALFELSKLRDEFRWKQFEAEMANRSIWGKAAVNLGQSFALLRAVMTSYDLSAIGRQGAFMLFSHPFRTLAAVPDMLKAFVSSEKRHAFEEGIGDRENAPLYKKYKLAITRNDGSLSSMEEVYMSRWLHSLKVNPKDGQPLRNIGRRLLNAPLGITRASERAYVTALNRIRADSFDAMVATLTKGGKEMTDAEGKLIADFVNSATGRATMPGKFEDAATMLNMVFFAPRLVTSRFQMLYGHHMLRGAGSGQKRVAAMIAAEYARAAASLYVIYQLATLWYIGSGAQEEDEEKDERRPFIEFDPRNSAFGQFRFGDHYVNPTGGLSQAATFMSRMITGETVTGAGEVQRLSDHGHSMTNFLADLKPALRKYGLTQLADSLPDANRSKRTPMEQDFGDVLGRFARTKLAPAPGAMYDAWTGTDMMGQPIAQQGFLNDLAGTESRALGALSGMMLPMTFGTPADAFREKGPLGGSGLTTAEIVGWGVQFRDRASFDMPDYQMASFDQKRDYSEYLRVSANIKQDIDELRNLANEFPADTPADEVISAVEAKAALLGLDGVKVKEYSPRTTARDEMGFKKTGLQRTETGKVKMDFEDSTLVSLMKDADKSIKTEDDKIKRVLFEDFTDAELDSMYRDYYPDGTADGDKKKVIDAIAAERERGMEFFMRARKE